MARKTLSPLPWMALVAAFALVVGACGDSGSDATTTTTSAPAATSAPSTVPATTIATTTTTTVPPLTGGELGEAFISAFYSFDADALANLPWASTADLLFVSYYQPWADGIQLEVIESSCIEWNDISVTCQVTVENVISTTVGLEQVVDTWSFQVRDGVIEGVVLDPPDEALVAYFDWAASEHPENLRGVCRDAFYGGPTPFECGESNVALVAEYVESEFYVAP